MNLDEIDKKCFILALFIRDDGQRFLLGSGAYEFKDSQLHFSANTMANDVVEVQGNDGYLLAGQVRRPTTQVFDGYIGDASINKPDIEGYRRDFFAFFQKNHFYTVVYIFPDGTAIQRRRGFIVDASEVRELYQMFPEYHIGLNFEDVNYYKYSEDEDGHEQYAKSIDINISKAVTGGLIWDSVSQTQAYNHGTDFSISGTIENEPVDYIDLYGDTEQTTYSGKNLANPEPLGYADMGITATYNAQTGDITLSGTASGIYSIPFRKVDVSIPAGTYTIKQYGNLSHGRMGINFRRADGTQITEYVVNTGTLVNTFTLSEPAAKIYLFTLYHSAGQTVEGTVKFQMETGQTPTSFEPYVGGTASPNPDYPQEVQTVTGRQVVTITDGDSQSQEYEINLGKNLLDEATMESGSFNYLNGGLFANATFIRSQQVPCEPNTTYAFSSNSVLGEFAVVYYASDKTTVVPGEGYLANYRSTTFTTPATARYMRVKVGGSANPRTLDGDWDLQIEKGSTATTYAPYFTPIELCKIGTYQDYIYKSGDDWYVHREIGKVVLDGTTGYWNYIDVRTNTTRFGVNSSDLFSSYNAGTSFYSQYFVYGLAYNTDAVCARLYGGNILYMSVPKEIGTTLGNISTPDTLLYWVNQNKPVFYLPLATATDTQITDATLITELEALNSATTYADVTWFKTESDDLPADTWAYVQIQAGGGVVWDNYGATWEEGGGGMIVNVNVDSIENVYPVWTVNGPTDTPILTNLTTGTSITYNGNITASQTLVVDMLNQTALLNGTSVIGKLSGDWIELAPGMNRMSYTATNEQTAPKSTLEWQEIVG